METAYTFPAQQKSPANVKKITSWPPFTGNLFGLEVESVKRYKCATGHVDTTQ